MYSTAVTDHLRSQPVQGEYTATEAVNLLLAGAPLQAVATREGTLTVHPKAMTVAAAETETETRQDTATLPKVKVTGKAENDAVWATDPYNTDYHQPNSMTATKTDTPIMETPYSVTIVPKEVLKDQQVIKIDDAVKNVAGVMAQPTNGQNSDSFIIRGFQNDTVYRNGFLLPSAIGGGTSKRETANLDRIEVLKGPGSILYGRSEPGGIINLVTKKPQATPYYSLQQQFGSYDFYRTTGDATGAISHDDSLLYRFNFAYEDSGSFRDFQKADKVFVAPSFTWNISDQTQVNFDIEYQRFDETGDSGQSPLLVNVPSIAFEPVNNRPAPIPRNREFGERVNNSNIGDRTFVGFDWSHAFNENWKLSQRFGTELWDLRSKYLFFYPGADAQGNLSRSFNNGLTQQQQYYTTLNLTGKFATGFIEHTLLTGFDYFVIDNQGTGNCCQYAGDFNIFRPTYLTTAPQFDPAGNSEIKGITQDLYSLYIQDQFKLPYNVFANVGVRYDDASSQKQWSYDNFVLTHTGHNHVSPRGGLLWRPIQWLSLYGSYTENFGQNNSLFNSPGQNQVQPQTAQQWELGTKTEFFDGRLSATFAYFDLTKQNIAITDYSTFIPSTKNIGEQESRGYEFEASGEILPGWKIIGAYTHLAYANINKDGLDGKSDNTGHRMMLTPRNFGSLWNTYELQSGQLRGLKFGGGVVGADLSQGDPANDYQLPGYMTVNLLTSYAIKVGRTKTTFQLNVNNLLDKTYYTGSNTAYQIGVGAPRTFLGSVKVEF
ncbi:TonB-dependent siderophore receptor [Methylovulum miyakonense]|uniref:TonB-dependent siderophore receptor n=1 Tax=Methylovulum miyakonense TaxID=645578 RepID=UPI000370A06A|nr:TonB-dependent receptor [Methylovulum miyakonense]